MTTTDFNKIFTHHTVVVNGVRLHYVMGGSGEPVVLLHGFPSTWYEWHKIMPKLAEQYTVIAPDLRGLGDSERPASGYDKKTLAEDIHQLVRALGYDKVKLVVHDWGNSVGYFYASAYPDEIERIAFLDALIPGLGYEVALDASHGPKFWFTPFSMVPDIPEALVAGRERIYLDYFYKELAYDPTAISEEDLVEYLRTYTAPGALRAAFGYYRTFFQDMEQAREYAKNKLKMPVLALGGSALLGENMLNAFKPLGEDVRGGVIERAGHFIPEEQPEQLLDWLLPFLAGKN